MLSPQVIWRDVDPTEWANLWRAVDGRRPHQIYAIVDAGNLIALVDSQHGALPLTEWPPYASNAHAAAALRSQFRADRVIVADVDLLEEIAETQQRIYRADQDYDDYVAACHSVAHKMLSERAVVVPDRAPIPVPNITRGELHSLIGNPTGEDGSGSFVITVFDHEQLWWSVVGRLTDGKIDMLTSSQGLRGTSDTGFRAQTPAQIHQRLLRAAAREVGPLRLSLSMTREEFASRLVRP